MYGGATHDSFGWKHCEERRLLQQLYTDKNLNILVFGECQVLLPLIEFFTNIVLHYIVGDSGYATEPWCIIPYACVAEDSAAAYFNEVHAKTRSIIERTIGILKRR